MIWYYRRHKAEIRKISKEQADSIVDTRRPLGLFYALVGKTYVGIDNTTGDAWTEAFSSLRKCRRWLVDSNITVEEI